jgi:predicted dehydrogenase
MKFTAAIIGAGRVGAYHTKGQLALGTQVIIYEPDTERAVAFQEQFKEVILAKSLDDAISAADVVHVCVPPEHHLAIALQCIQQHKPTIIEKPLALNLEEAIQIYEAALAAKDTPVILATSFRVGPAFPIIYDSVHAGNVGLLTSIETSYAHDVKNLEVGKTWRKQLQGTAFLYEGGSHGVDLNMWLANQPVSSVQAVVGTKKVLEDYQWDEDFAINLKYQDGLIGRVWVSAAAPLPRHGSHVEIYGSAGAYRVHSKEAYYESFKDGQSDWIQHPVDVERTMLTIQTMASIFNDYVQGKRKDFKPMPDVADGIRLMVVMHAIEKAIASGCTELVSDLDEVLSHHASL